MKCNSKYIVNGNLSPEVEKYRGKTVIITRVLSAAEVDPEIGNMYAAMTSDGTIQHFYEDELTAVLD